MDSNSAVVPHKGMAKPSIADALKVGFFSQDRAVQTECSEIVEVKEMTEVIQALLKDTNNLKRDLLLTRQWMQSDFESKMQQKATELYCQINDKVGNLEKTHDERMDIVRRAFRQQLADGLQSVNQSYNRSMQKKIKSAQRHQTSEADKWQQMYKEMEDNVRSYESTIRMLREQLEELKKTSVSADQVVLLQAEIEDMKQENRKLHKTIERLEEGIDAKDQELAAKDAEIKALNDSNANSKEIMDKLLKENQEAKEALIKEREEAQKRLEQQRAELEQQMESRTKGARDEVMALARKEAEALLEAERVKYRQLMEEKSSLEELLAKEKAKVAEMKKVKIVEPPPIDVDAEKSKRSVVLMRAEIEKLKREIDRINKAWEKKFAILQQSMRALKDESYLRATLQRQAAQLSQVAVTYSMDNPHYPAGLPPTTESAGLAPPKRPLPGINQSKTPGAQANAREQFCYTTSAPSGGGAELFSVHENQVMSDDEDLPENCVPLPPPPERGDTRENHRTNNSVRLQTIAAQ